MLRFASGVFARSACWALLGAVLMWPQATRAEEEHTPIPKIVEKMPQRVQNVVENMAQSREPPDRFLFSLLGLPRSRFGSGTAWLADASPLYGAVPHAGKWGFIISGNLFTGYNWFNSRRGWRRFMGRNTLNAAVFRTFHASEVMLRVALSFEPLTIGDRGYPLIAQTGQERDGTLVHDRQYALDLFRELAVTYSWEVTRRWAATLYLAAAGEPAFGPVTFTQRVSASADPLAPLVLQIQESSHASFGVVTLGFFTRRFKIEASWFNGDLPGKERYGLHIRKPNAYALRLSWNPDRRWSLQASYGFMEEPLSVQPTRSDHRASTSASYTYWYAQDAGVASTLSVAQRITTSGVTTTGLLAESYWNVDGHHAVFGRVELTQKSGIELALAQPTPEQHPVGTLVAGYVYYFGPIITLAPGLGLRASITPLAQELAGDYGTRVPFGLMVFGQLRTAALPFGS